MRLAALTAALVGAALLPGQPLGIGVLLVAVLVAAAAATETRPTVDAISFGAAALALAALAAVLDAAWVVVVDLLAAWLLASAAVAGPTLAAAAAPFASLRALPTLVPSVPADAAPAARGVLLGGLLTAPFGLLFWTGDAAFAELGGRLPLPSVDEVPGRSLTFALILLAALGLALASRRAATTTTDWRPWRRPVLEWALPLALLDALFLLFVAVQLAVLFGGHDHVLRTAGLTYAEYARQGFWHLLAAATLTVAVIGGAHRLVAPANRAEQLLLRALLATMSALTLVILLSALHRLRVYEDAFGLTRARLAAETFDLWLAAFFSLLFLAAAAPRLAPHVPRLLLAGTAATLILFSLGNPDARIAERNLERWHETGRLDLAYLQTLSADAAPTIANLPRPLRRRALATLAARLDSPEPWSSTNLSRKRARTLLDQHRLSAAAVSRCHILCEGGAL